MAQQYQQQSNGLWKQVSLWAAAIIILLLTSFGSFIVKSQDARITQNSITLGTLLREVSIINQNLAVIKRDLSWIKDNAEIVKNDLALKQREQQRGIMDGTR